MGKREIIAREIYDEYCKGVGGVAFNGDPLPKSYEFFDDQSKQKQANAWRMAADKAIQLIRLT